MKKLLFAVSALALASAPAHAQLLGGGGGLGGMVNGTIGSAGSIGGIGGFDTVGSVTDTVSSTTGGALDGSAATSGGQNVDHRSGRVEANRSANANASANLGQVLNTPIAPVGASGSGSGSAEGNGNANAQLIGTDTVGGIAGQGVSQVQGTAQTAQSTAGGLVGQASSTPGAATGLVGGVNPGIAGVTGGSASGSANGEANGTAGGNLVGSTLATAGSAAAAGQGAFAVTPGMDILSGSGQQIGEVQQVVADSQGRVSQVIVENGDGTFALPASSLSGSGNALVAGSGTASAN